MEVRLFVPALLLLSVVGCERRGFENDKSAGDNGVLRGVDLSGVYRADKALQAALPRSTVHHGELPELERLTLALKTQLSVLQDRISYDQRLQALSPFVERYGRILSGYQGYEEMQALVDAHIDCILEPGAFNDLCDKRFNPQESAVTRKLSSVGIACDPHQPSKPSNKGVFAQGGQCDFTTQISVEEAEATRAYLQLTQP